ncbi:hypothetical protein MA785_000774 [Vibrio parahaemolyticus]|nr:hypothetical protein [Vibrio parahaemolyticus]EJR2787883.1 hypothetical protein [Vibrio parahaemolyticus]
MAVDYEKLKAQREEDKRKRREENQKLFGEAVPLTKKEKVALREEAEDLGFFSNDTIETYVQSVASEKDIECEDMIIMFFVKMHYLRLKKGNVESKIEEFEQALSTVRRDRKGFLLPDMSTDVLDFSISEIKNNPETFFHKNESVLDDIKLLINL